MTKKEYDIDRGGYVEDKDWLSSQFESRKDVPTPDTYLFYNTNSVSFLENSLFIRYTSGRLQPRINKQ